MEPNYYYVGLSLKQTTQCHASTEPLAFDFAADGNANEKKICIECNITTRLQCQTCDAAYCRKCFDKTHSEGKVMRKHIIIDLDDYSGDTPKSHCQQHENLPFVNFCNVCRIEMCVTCTKYHDKKHTIKSIKLMVSSWLDLRNVLTELVR